MTEKQIIVRYATQFKIQQPLSVELFEVTEVVVS